MISFLCSKNNDFSFIYINFKFPCLTVFKEYVQSILKISFIVGYKCCVVCVEKHDKSKICRKKVTLTVEWYTKVCISYKEIMEIIQIDGKQYG